LAIWTQDFGGSIGNTGGASVHFAEVPEQPAIVEYSTIVANNDGYWSPPKIKQAPNGDVWVCYTGADDTERSVELICQFEGDEEFGPPFIVAEGGRHENADFCIDESGYIHIVWIEEGDSGGDLLNYAILDPDTGEHLRDEVLTSVPGTWDAPCIVLDSTDLPFVVFGEYGGESVGNLGDIWFTRALFEDEPSTPVRAWHLYE
jgi:hypothetical protein